MNGLAPVVRYLIACEDVVVDPDQPRNVTLVNLVSGIRSLAESTFPFRHPELCVFVQLTECRGSGRVGVRITNADSGRVVFATRTRTVQLSDDPLEVVALSFRIRNCPFQEPGLYWIQFAYNERVIAQVPLTVR